MPLIIHTQFEFTWLYNTQFWFIHVIQEHLHDYWCFLKVKVLFECYLGIVVCYYRGPIKSSSHQKYTVSYICVVYIFAWAVYVHILTHTLTSSHTHTLALTHAWYVYTHTFMLCRDKLGQLKESLSFSFFMLSLTPS